MITRQHWAINNRIGGNGKNGGDSIVRNTWMSTASIGFSSKGLYPKSSPLHDIYFGVGLIAHLRIAGAWKGVKAIYVRVNGVWKKSFALHYRKQSNWSEA